MLTRSERSVLLRRVSRHRWQTVLSTPLVRRLTSTLKSAKFLIIQNYFYCYYSGEHSVFSTCQSFRKSKRQPSEVQGITIGSPGLSVRNPSTFQPKVQDLAKLRNQRIHLLRFSSHAERWSGRGGASSGITRPRHIRRPPSIISYR